MDVPRRLPPSPTLSARELGGLAIGAALLAVAMFWPLVLHLGTDVPKDLGDPLSQAWQLAWGGHALVEQPGRFFQSNQFWPGADTLALSDALVGYAPLAVPGDGVAAAIARYDLLFLFATALAFAGAYLLARELGVPPGAAIVAGAVFAYAPWRLEQGGHLHILSSGGIPLSLMLLLRGYRSARPRLVVAGWAVVAWQVSIGFSLGLPYLVVLAGGGALVVLARWRGGEPVLPPRPLLRATALGVAIVLVTSVAIGRPYLRVRDGEPAAQRSAETLATYSVGPKQFLISSSLNPVWGPAGAGAREDLPAVAEQTLFPGLVAVVLAAIGALWGGWSRVLRRRLVAGTGLFAVLSLGFETSGIGQVLPYRALYELVPGFSGIRVPQRMNTFTSLLLALLAAGGAAAVAARLGAAGRGRTLARAVPVVLAVLVLAEGAGFGPGRWYPHPTAPTAPAGLSAVDAPLLQLPVRAQDNREYLLWSTDGLAPMVNGRSSIQPRRTTALLAELDGFPDVRSVRALRGLGVRSVVLHADRLAGTPWRAWRSRPLTGLGLQRDVRGDLVVFRVR